MNNTFQPFTRLKRPLAESRVALVSTAGLYLRHWQAPFQRNDPTWREFPVNVELEDLAIAHGGFDDRHARADLNVLLPVDRLRALVAAGEVGGPAPFHYSFMGNAPDTVSLLADHGLSAADRLRLARADAALVLPASPACLTPAVLIARLLEVAGTATFLLAGDAAPLDALKPPRSAVARFPAGAPLGEPGNAELHLAVLRHCLRLWEDMERPVGPVTLPYAWGVA